MRFVLNMAGREIRGSGGRLLVFFFGIGIGVASMVSVRLFHRPARGVDGTRGAGARGRGRPHRHTGPGTTGTARPARPIHLVAAGDRLHRGRRDPDDGAGDDQRGRPTGAGGIARRPKGIPASRRRAPDLGRACTPLQCSPIRVRSSRRRCCRDSASRSATASRSANSLS